MTPAAEGPLLYGTFFECAGRTLDCAPQEALRLMMMHLLRLCFPAARQLSSPRQVLRCADRGWSEGALAHPAMALLWEKAEKAAPGMPHAEDMAAHPKLVKGLVLRFVQYHLHPHRLYCVRTAAQLLADLAGRPVSLLWCTPAQADARPPSSWFWPIEQDGYLTLDTSTPAVRICCERDPATGTAVFALLAPRPLATPRGENAPLRLLREMSDDEESDYALWVTAPLGQDDRRAEYVSTFLGKRVYHARLLRPPQEDQLYMVYPASAHRSLLPPFPPGTALHIFAGEAPLAQVTAHDVYPYFALPSDAQTVTCVLAESAEVAARLVSNECA